MEGSQSSTKRGKAFTPDQDIAICNAWLTITQDPIVGNSQSQNKFWNRIFQNYLDHCNDENVRTQVVIQSRWGIIMKFCSKYCACVRQIENRQQSGINETDKVLQAKSLYFENEKKHFSLDHYWAILEHAIKWEDLGSSKKPKSPAMTPYSFSPFSSSASRNPETPISLDSDEDRTEKSVESPTTKRPSGRKAAKEARKKSKITDTSDTRFCDLMEKFNENANDRYMKKCEIEERKVKVMEQMNQREQEEKEAKEKKRDEKIMMMDLSNMDPQAKLYYQLRKNEILAKLQARSTNFDYYVPFPPSPP